MALETLLELHEIDGERIGHNFEDEGFVDESAHIQIDHTTNTISFKIQDGPVKETGYNGCQVDHLIAVAGEIIAGLDRKFPCDANKKALESLVEAWESLAIRKIERQRRGVEGTSQQ